MRAPLTLFALVALACATLAWAGDALGLSGIAPLGIALTFLFAAIHGAERSGGLAAHGIALGGLLGGGKDDDRSLLVTLREGIAPALRELGVALGLAILVFPPFVLGYVYFHGLSGTFALRLPEDPIGFLLTHLVLVAIPEEAFFRGYLQTRFDAALTGWRVPRMNVGVAALVLQALLFAAVHIVTEPEVARIPARAATFFPALVFGCLRGNRGGIGAAVWFHFLCNVLAELLYLGMR
jgi:membrane protease YdiL (CAAX protease family)